MTDRQIRSVVIVGCGTAGRMAAASLTKFPEKLNVRIRLVESEKIGTVGGICVLGIDENDVIRQIKATFSSTNTVRSEIRRGQLKMGEFEAWRYRAADQRIGSQGSCALPSPGGDH